MASVFCVLHLTIPALYFCFCNKGSLCSFRHLENFLDEDSFLCSLATKLRHTQEWIICLRSANGTKSLSTDQCSNKRRVYYHQS